MLLANGGAVVETIGSLFAAAQPASDGNNNSSSGGNGGADGVKDGSGGGDGTHGASSGISSSRSGGWTPRRVVIFQPRVSSPEVDARALARELADHVTRLGFSSGSPGRDGGGASTAEVVRPVWLVDSVGSFRVLRPTEVHRVSLPCVSNRVAMEL